MIPGWKHHCHILLKVISMGSQLGLGLDSMKMDVPSAERAFEDSLKENLGGGR